MTMSLCECLSLGLSGDYMSHYNKNADKQKGFLLAVFSIISRKPPAVNLGGLSADIVESFPAVAGEKKHSHVPL